MLMACLAFGLVACGGNASDSQQGSSQNTEQNGSQSTEDKNSEEEIVDDGKIEYTVIVVDANGAPVEGKMVQICDEGNCYNPVVTDANGKAVYRLAESSEYKAKILVAYGEEDVYDYVNFEAGETEVTLTAVN